MNDRRRVSARRLGRVGSAVVAMEAILGIGAAGGGIALMAGPRGEILPLPLAALRGSPFTTYFLPGAILFAVLGIGALCAAALTLWRHRVGPLVALAVGGALVVWIAVEIAIIGYSNRPPLQAIYLALGIAIVAMGLVWSRQRRADELQRA